MNEKKFEIQQTICIYCETRELLPMLRDRREMADLSCSFRLLAQDKVRLLNQIS